MGTKYFFDALVMKYFFILISAFFLVAPIASAEEVEGVGYLVGYRCEPNEPNLSLINQAKRDAVINAEFNCSWDMERPVVKRIGEWDIDLDRTRRGSSGLSYWAVITVKTMFQCIYPLSDQ